MAIQGLILEAWLHFSWKIYKKIGSTKKKEVVENAIIKSIESGKLKYFFHFKDATSEEAISLYSTGEIDWPTNNIGAHDIL